MVAVVEIGTGEDRERKFVGNNDEDSSSTGVYIRRVGGRNLERNEGLIVLTSSEKTHVESTLHLSSRARLAHVETVKDTAIQGSKSRRNLGSIISDFFKKPQTESLVSNWHDLKNTGDMAVFTLNNGDEMTVRHVDSILTEMANFPTRPFPVHY